MTDRVVRQGSAWITRDGQTWPFEWVAYEVAAWLLMDEKCPYQPGGMDHGERVRRRLARYLRWLDTKP